MLNVLPCEAYHDHRRSSQQSFLAMGAQLQHV